MSSDQQLRQHLERAAGSLQVDTDRQLDRIHHVVERRGRGRRVRTMTLAAVIGIVAVILVWQLRLVDEPPFPPAGSPTGRVLYLGAKGSHRGAFGLDVVTGDVATLTEENASVLWAAWSPDGSRLAYIQQEPGPRYAVVVADADGNHPVTIHEEDDASLPGPDLIDLSWSPDGDRIAYSGRAPGHGRTILIVNTDGTGEPIVLDGLWVSVSWSPNGDRLLVLGFPEAGAHEGQFDLYTIRPDGSDPVQLTDDAATEHEPSWSPDGARIVFASGEDDLSQDIYVMNADGSDVRKLTDWAGLDLLPIWAPDGQWVAFASDRDATPAQRQSNRSGDAIFSGLSLYVMHADGSGVSMLLHGDEVLPVSWRG